MVCDVSGYGDSGPFVNKKAYDLLIQAEAGRISVNGTADEPARVGLSIADIATGMYSPMGILRRRKTEAGPVRGLLPPFIFADQAAATGAVPSVGQHADAVLSEVGFSPDRIAAMRAAGAI